MILTSKGQGGIYLQSQGNTTQFVVANTTSAVNYLQVAGGATGVTPSMSAAGSDTNINLALTPKGTGVVTTASQLTLTKATGFNLYASGAADNYMAGRLGIGFAPYSNLLLLLNGYVNSSSTSANVVLNTASSDTNTSVTFTGFYTQLSTSTTALTNLTYYAANQGTLSGTVSIQRGFQVTNTLIGAATNIGFNSDIPAGSGNFNFWAGGTAQNVFQGQTSIGGYIGSESLRATPTASAVNYVNVIGAITTASPAIQAAGSDTNIDLVLTPKGTGVLQYGTYTAGVVFQTGYITIKDAGGTTRRLLVG
jgi:hypothetical protein